MNDLDISKAREIIGASLSSWVVSPNMTHRLHKGFWLFLSGVPSPAVNMAMVYENDRAALDETH